MRGFAGQTVDDCGILSVHGILLYTLKTITDCLRKHIKNLSACFVFPTQVEADVWAEKALEVTGCGSVSLERFIAWDRFKESSIKARVTGRRSVSSVLRSLFVYRLLCENAVSPFFEELIPKPFARDFAPFTRYLSRLLPSLALLKRRLAEKGALDAEDADLLVLEKRYSFFLDEFGLFEPAWEIPPFNPDGRSYILFFPEIIEDFDEYELLLSHSPQVTIMRTAEEERDLKPFNLTVVENARDELRLLARRILNDHLVSGIEFDDIAVHVPGLDLIEPYLLREFRLHGIPIRFRSGKPLTGYAAGSLFTLIQGCIAGGFAVPVLKRFLTQTVFPWAHPDLNAQLLRFGEENRCDCALERGDIWLETFRLFPKEERLRAYYEHLKTALGKLGGGRSFYEIRSAYFAFRSRFFDMTLFTQNPALFTTQTDAVMARCVEELTALIQAEQEYPELSSVLLRAGAPGHFDFFVQTLSQKQYLPREQGRGVHVFAYKAAACASFSRQYVINASQSETSVVINPLGFLSREKRQRMGIADKNSSESFFALYQASGEQSFFTCAQKTFNGYATPHGAFLASPERLASNGAAPAADCGDLWRMERQWWAMPDGQAFVPRLFPLQKAGFAFWNAGLGSRRTGGAQDRENLLRVAAASAARELNTQNSINGRFSLIRKKITDKKERDGVFRISASDMNTFFSCPLKWLYERIFAIYNPKTAETMISPQAMGSFYHAVIAQVLDHIRVEGENVRPQAGLLNPERMDDYAALIEQSVNRCAEGKDFFDTVLPRLILHSSLSSVQKTLEDFFAFLSGTFKGFSVAATEQSYQYAFENGSVLTGIVDCILYRDGGWCILDFKKNVLPEASKYCLDGGTELGDFQIPLYKYLFEQSAHTPDAVTQAAFVSIENSGKRLVSILGENPVSSRARSVYPDVGQFETVMDAFLGSARQYQVAVSSPDPSSFERDVAFSTCVGCPFNTLCRTTYFISGERSCSLTS